MIVASQNTQNSHINDINQLNNNMFILFKVFNKEKLTKFEEERYNELQISKLNVSQLKELINSKFMNDYFNDEDNEATREFEERLLALENKYSTEAYSSNINSYVTEKDWLDLRKEVKSQIQRFLDFHKFVKKSWEWLLENGENIGGGLELTGTGLDVGIAALGLIGAGFHILKHTIGNKEYSKEHIIIALDFVLETSKK
ncbi:hypothetical protein [Mycoplasmopsis caviae]|nr:hypothetical protein [Mycoplasmopsis caviae]VDR42497.1 Uncharacterised protein [Mycoplasmopsis caviae]